MDEPFFLPVTYRGTAYQFPAILVQRGYIHVIVVEVGEVAVTYERDDEGNWRALVPPEHVGKPPAVDLLRAIGDTIEEILK